MTPALKGWHRGERIVRQRLGYDKLPETALFYLRIHAEMPEQHSTFYSTRLEFLPVCVLDEDGRPWSSILADKDGKLGFVRHPKFNTLDITAKLWPGEPFWKVLKAMELGQHPALIAGVGVEVSTRRRNKFAGKVLKAAVKGDIVDAQLLVNEALGNCPKYIAVRQLEPHPSASGFILEDRPYLSAGERLSDEAIALIQESDTVWFGTTYVATDEESSEHPSHLGMNHRGGRPGFMRVKPSDGRTVVLPDFSGDRYMTSLGNVEATPLASLTFISFTTGDILYITGKARNLFGAEAKAVMPFQDGLTEIYVTGYTYLRDAFPARQVPGCQVQPSPYSPPVKLLAEEDSSSLFSQEAQPKASLIRVTMHSPTIATFEWESSLPLKITPGQAIILDFRPLLGERVYQHMSDDKPSVLNDDFIRTWTVSSASNAGNHETRRFSLTIREKVGGAVTPVLFSIARKASESQSYPEEANYLDVPVHVVGITGDFVLPQFQQSMTSAQSILHLVWVAGGIGITPFLSMLAALSRIGSNPPFKISLIISTREPDVLLSLITLSLGLGEAKPLPPYITVDIFTGATVSDAHTRPGFVRHEGRLSSAFFEKKKDVLELSQKGTEVFVCGPEAFERVVLDSMSRLGVDSGRVHREGFAY